MTRPELGRRIHVIGNSSGRITLAARLSAALSLPLVELDALNSRPGWVGLNDTDPERFEACRGRGAEARQSLWGVYVDSILVKFRPPEAAAVSSSFSSRR